MMPNRLLPGLPAALLPLLLPSASAQDKPPRPPAWLASPKIEVAGLKHWYGLLTAKALRDREAGSEGFARSADRLTRQFAAWGWRAHPSTPAYRQKFKLAHITLGQGQSLTVEGKALRLFDHFVPQRTSANGVAKGVVVDVGLGIDIPELGVKSLAGKELKGRIALINRSGLRGLWDRYRKLPKAKRDLIRNRIFRSSAYFAGLARAGAVGVISYRPPTSNRSGRSGAYRTRDSRGRLTFYSGITTSPRPGAPFPSIEVDHSVGTGLAGRRVAFRVDLVHDTRETANLVAYRPGTAPKGPVVVLGANLDNRMTPARQGASRAYTWTGDNAAGCAVVMEVARVLARRNPSLRHTLVLALWSGRMKQLSGSRHYTKNPLFPLRRTALALNLDRPGWRIGKEDKGLHLSYPIAHRHLQGLLERALGDLKGKAAVAGLDYLYGGDAWPFIDNRIPTVNLHRRRLPRTAGTATRPTTPTGPPDPALLARHARVALRLLLDPGLPAPVKKKGAGPSGK